MGGAISRKASSTRRGRPSNGGSGVGHTPGSVHFLLPMQYTGKPRPYREPQGQNGEVKIIKPARSRDDTTIQSDTK